MGKGVFPDILGPQSITTNSLTAPKQRRKLNLVCAGLTAADNPAKARTDVTLPVGAFVTVSASTSSAGEWQPTVNVADIDMLRVSSSVSGTLMTGFDVTGYPVKLEKFVTNYGTHTIELQAPAAAIGGKAYYLNEYTLRVSETVHVVWDAVSLGFRIVASSTTAHSYLLLDSVPLALDGSRLRLS